MHTIFLQQLKPLLHCKKGYFVTATDTNVGKTIASSLIVRALDAHYFKPIQCGDLEKGGDTATIKGLCGLSQNNIINPIYALKHPLSPNQAAEYEDIHIDPNMITLPIKNKPIIVEGAGGVLVPITSDFFMIDLIKKFNLPVILVTRSSLGTLNHTFLTLEALSSRDIQIDLILVNGRSNPDNLKTIKALSNIDHVLEMPFIES